MATRAQAQWFPGRRTPSKRCGSSLGIDDTRPARLRIMPRMPFGWSRIAVEEYPVVLERSNRRERALLRYELVRMGEGMEMKVSADKDLGPVMVRLGPLERRSPASGIRINGVVHDVSMERSGDSWWARCTVGVGQEPGVEERRSS